jgi:hypothetical protein
LDREGLPKQIDALGVLALVTSGAKARHDKKAGYCSAEALRHLKSEFFRNLLG